MSEATERLLVRIDATTEQLRRELKKADTAVAGTSGKISKAIDKINVSFSGLGLALGAAGLGAAFASVFKATAEQERVTAQLNATLASTGFAAGKTADELLDTAAGLQKVSRFGDEAIIGMQSLLLTFKDIKGDNFDRTTKAVLDMSTAMGQDLKSSALQLGKALNDPIGQLGALSRTGVIFSDSQKELIKSLAASGDMAGAQVEILKELEAQFGGSAEAARNTLAGALDGLSMAFGDLFEAQGSALAPMKESLNELEAILSDPKFVQSVQDITAAILSMGAAAASALPAVVDFSKWLGEEMAASIGAVATDDIPRLESALAKLREELAFYEKNGHGAERGTEALRESIKKLEAQLKTAYSFQENLSVSTAKGAEASKAGAKAMAETVDETKKVVASSKEYAKVLKELDKSLEKINKRHEKANEAMQDGIDELDDLVRSNEEYIDQLEFEVSLLGKTEREQTLLTVAREQGARATEEQRARMVALNATLYDAEAATKAAAEAQKPFQDALQGTIERIDSAFSDAWRGAFDSFSDFADGIKNSFKNLLAELAHIAITRPIIMSIGGAMGLGTSAAASAGGLGGGGVGGILSSIGGMGAGMYGNIGDALSYIGADRLAQQSYLTGMTATPGSLAMSAGAGLLGGFAGNAVFGGGGYSNIGATIGGLGGSIFGPIGAGVGSFLGSGIGSLFGGDNNGDNKGRASINLATGESNVFGVGKSFNQANVDALNSLVPFLQNLADALGGSTANLDVSMGNNSGLSLNGQKFGKDEAGFIAAAIEAMVDGAKTLSPLLKTLIKGFDGTSEELANFAISMVGITELIAENPVDKAFKDFADAQQAAGMRLTQVYDKQIRELDKLIYGFDGSAQAAVDLNQALSQNKQLAYDMALAIKAIGESTNTAVNDQIRFFRESTRTPDENLVAMEREFARLMERLPDIKNPENIDRVTQRLLDLNRAIFEAGPEDLQRSNRQTYIDAARFIEEQQAIALENAGQTLQASQQDLNTQVGAMLEVAASGFQAPADTMMTAAQLMYNAVQQFIQQGGYNEVAA
jgi:hypothetical protein